MRREKELEIEPYGIEYFVHTLNLLELALRQRTLSQTLLSPAILNTSENG